MADHVHPKVVGDPLSHGAVGLARKNAREVESVYRTRSSARRERRYIALWYAHKGPSHAKRVKVPKHLTHGMRALILVAMHTAKRNDRRPRFGPLRNEDSDSQQIATGQRGHMRVKLVKVF
jgi:hypothetical protein